MGDPDLRLADARWTLGEPERGRDDLRARPPPRSRARSSGRDAIRAPTRPCWPSAGTRWPDGIRTAVFAMGCFWGAEKDFWQLPGVVSTAVGYAGGYTPNPTYEEVMPARARPTFDRGHRMRSRLEARFAGHLDDMGQAWLYEPCRCGTVPR